MLLTLEEYAPTWKTLRRQVITHSTAKLVLIVSCIDVDAVCAAKMLVQLLRKDLILHQVIPVVGQSSLKQAFAGLDGDISNVVLVGCGATIDIDELVGTSALEGRQVHIIDNHRPWSLENLYGSPNVLCYDDGSAEDLDEYKGAWEYLANQAEESGSEDDDGQVYGYKRKREDDTRVESSELILRYMNQGSYLSSTNTVQVYTLLTMLGETNKRSLWLMVVGVCALESLSPEIYMNIFPVIRDEIVRLGDPKVSLSSKEVAMSVEMDFSLFLLREWSFYESLVHSSYVSSKFRLWTESGRNKLNKMLAQMGVALQEAKQKWTFMDQRVKRELKDRLSEVMELYDIQNILRNGVVRKFGYSGTVSASDCSEAIAALLENPGHLESGRPELFWKDNFWEAWNSLENVERLRSGMGKAKTLQRVVVQSSQAVFEKGQPKNLKTYRLVVVQDGNELETLSNPLTLMRLGVWIADGCSEMESYSHQPLVIAALKEEKGTYLVLGMAPRRRRDEVTNTSGPIKNRFGSIFQKVAGDINASVAIDAFDSAILEIRKDDLSRFLESLHSELLS